MFNLKEFLGLNYFVSGIDRFLKDYDIHHNKLSHSQKLEKDKYARIYHLRDHAEKNDTKKTFWENF
jgi:hypothetical protein